MAYASGTNVSVDKSVGEIRNLIMKYGGSQYGYFEGDGEAHVGFVMHNLSLKISVKLPQRNEKRFTKCGRFNDQDRTAEAAHRLWNQAVREQWRALVLVVKAKLVAVDQKVATFENEFMAYVVCAGGHTLGQRMLPQLRAAQKQAKELGVPGQLALPAPSGPPQEIDGEIVQ